jgi:ATP-binding cassette subfamily C protein
VTAQTDAAVGALPTATPGQVRRAWWRLARQDGRTFLAMIVLNVVAAALGLVAPWLLGRVVDTVRTHGGMATVNHLTAAILVVTLVQILLSRYARYVGLRFGERTSAALREQFLDRALAVPLSHVERAGAGELVARGTTDVGQVMTILRDAAPDVLISGIQAVLILAAVLLLDPLLGGIGVAGLLGILVALRWYLHRAPAAYLAEAQTNSQVAEMLNATAFGARTIDALSLGERHRTASGETLGRARAAMLRTLSLRTVLFPVTDVSYVIPVVGVLVAGGLLINAGHATLGTVVAAVLYLRQLATPLDAILVRTEQLQSSAASFARLEGLTRIPAAPEPTSQRPGSDRLEVDDVRFAYEPGHAVLRGVSLEIRPGERLAIVGPSGAGKSTLGKLLAGVDDPDSGQVTVGGVPVGRLQPAVLREHIVLVTQEYHVFTGSLRDNLLIARPDATDERLHEALRAVGATWPESLPDGLDTEVGNGDGALNGAQAQQVALARVILADPHTVVLDEATALLDPATARNAERSLMAVLAGRTVVAIAHRLHTAHDADRIAVMADGRLAEIGSHDALVAADGVYAGLWRSWHAEDGPV